MYCARRPFSSDSSRIAAAAVIAQATKVDAIFAGSVLIYFVIDNDREVCGGGHAVDIDSGCLQGVEPGRLTGSGYPAAACVDDADASAATTKDYHR